MNTAGSPPSWIGQGLGDQQRYKLVQPLGDGGIGEVYLAIDTRLGRRVAVKLLKGALAKSKEVLTRFEREVILSAALESEHIVEVLDYSVAAGDHPFYVMEYLQGQPLSQLTRRSIQMSPELTVQIAIQICAALKVAHEGVVLWREGEENTEKVKVIHRDLKPANIFLVPTAIGALVKVLDFGIAKKMHTAEQSNQTNLTQAFLGTFRYASPEQLVNARNIDERADLYSLGMILYEMLSGTDPFGVGTDSPKQGEVAWATAHDAGKHIPLRQRPECAHISVELEEIVMRCLKRQASERFSSAQEMIQALYAVPAIRKETPLPLLVAFLDPTVTKPLLHVLEPTLHRPLVPEASRIPHDTVAQDIITLAQQQATHKYPSVPEATGDATGALQCTEGDIASEPKSSSPQLQPFQRDETVVQIPSAPIAPQEANQPSLPQQAIALCAVSPPSRDETVAQVSTPVVDPQANTRPVRLPEAVTPPPSQPRTEETMVQIPPPVSNLDATVVQVPEPNIKQDAPHKTVAQVPPVSSGNRHEPAMRMIEAGGGWRNEAPTPPLKWDNASSADETVFQASKSPLGQLPFLKKSDQPESHSNSGFSQLTLHNLLLVGAGVLLGLLIMGAVYVFLRPSQPQPQPPPQSSSGMQRKAG